MVVALGAEDARELLIESGGQIQVNCEFCGQNYAFDSIDLEGLLTGAGSSNDSLQ